MSAAKSPIEITANGQKLWVVEDGPVDPSPPPAESPLRVLHILKEPKDYRPDGLAGAAMEAIDPATHTIKPNRGYKVWRVIALRTWCVENALSTAPNYGAIAGSLRRSVVWNLNYTIPPATKNRSKTNFTLLRRLAVPLWKDFYQREQQLAELNPDLVVCPAKDCHWLIGRKLLKVTGWNGNDDFFVWRGIPFVRTHHPAAFGNDAAQLRHFADACANATPWIYRRRGGHCPP